MSDFTQEQLDAAVAEATATATAAGKAEGAQEERARQAGIKALAEAQDRPVAAAALASNSDMSVDAAKTVLAAMPVETAPKAEETTTEEPAPKAEDKTAKGFAKAMEEGNPEVGADDNANVVAHLIARWREERRTDGAGSGHAVEPAPRPAHAVDPSLADVAPSDGDEQPVEDATLPIHAVPVRIPVDLIPVRALSGD